MRILTTSFPAFSCLFVQTVGEKWGAVNLSIIIIKRKLCGGLNNYDNIILFSRVGKQYFTYSLLSFVRYCFYHSKIIFISLHQRVVSSMCGTMYINSVQIIILMTVSLLRSHKRRTIPNSPSSGTETIIIILDTSSGGEIID